MTQKPKILVVSDSPVLHTGMGIAHYQIAGRLCNLGRYEVASFGWFAHTAEQRGIKWNLPWQQYVDSDTCRPYGHPVGWPSSPN